MILQVHSNICSTYLLLIGATYDSNKGNDIITCALNEDWVRPSALFARLQILYNSVLENKILTKDILRPLTKEISELKIDKLRLLFFHDLKIPYREGILPRMLIFCHYFKKATDKTPQSEINYACAVRNQYYAAKGNTILDIHDIREKDDK